MATAYLGRTVSNTGSKQKATLSMWTKRSGLGINNFYGFYESGTSNFRFRFDGNDKIDIENYKSSSTVLRFVTNRVFRDVGAFYNIVVEIDTTQATETNRFKLYINGVQETSFSTATYPSQNLNLTMNEDGHTQQVGSMNGTNPYNGLMTHVYWIDGTAYTPTSFGEVDSTSGIWKAKSSASVTYGNNGFFLKMENSGAMGTDSSGKSNNFTVNGTLTQNIDTPDNNFATLNPLDNPYVGQKATFTNGNTTGAGTETGFLAGASTIGVSSKKYYAEFKLTAGTSTYQVMGVVISPVGDMGTQAPHDNTKFYGARGNGTKYQPGGSGTSSWTGTWTTNDIIGLALDADNNRLYISKNGQYADGSGNYDEAFTGSPAYVTLASGQTYHFMGGSITTGSGVSLTMQSNFGNGKFGTTAVSSAGTNASGNGIFEYDVPTGYTALSTKGLNS